MTPNRQVAAKRAPDERVLHHTSWLRKLHLVDGAHLERLQRLGLTSYEARAYLALLRRDSSTAAETARIAGLPRQRVYDVLSSLVEKGLASTRPGKAVKYSATSPEQALGSLVTQHRQQLADLERGAKLDRDGLVQMAAKLGLDVKRFASDIDTVKHKDLLERDKALVLRSIKELEFDRAMGKVGDADFAEVSAGLRARA